MIFVPYGSPYICAGIFSDACILRQRSQIRSWERVFARPFVFPGWYSSFISCSAISDLAIFPDGSGAFSRLLRVSWSVNMVQRHCP